MSPRFGGATNRWQHRRSTSKLLVMGLLSVAASYGAVSAGHRAVVAAEAPTVGQPGVLPAVDLDALNPDPIKQWGVVGIGTTSSAAKPQVWDFAEIGNRIYVAGNFTGVQRNGDDRSSQVFDQPYLAAFDRDSGAWIASFAPRFDRTVYSLAVAPNGKLLVGGEFTSVNGSARTGLVMLDPRTGATDAAFTSQISGRNTPMVRDILRDGSQIYIAGQFSNVRRGANSFWVWNTARISGTTGAVDGSWVPKFAGGIWQLAIDPVRGRVIAAGSFTSVNAQPGTALLASVARGNGGFVPGLTPFLPNDPGQTNTIGVVYANDRVYVGGSQHMLQVLSATSNSRIGYNTTGLSCDSFSIDDCSIEAGGDFQVVEVAAGGTVLAGCHCFETIDPASALKAITHFSTFSGQRTDNRVAIGYHTTDSRVASAFVPGIRENTYGTYALFVDTKGCYYVGGYYTRQSDGDWLGGFGRFCATVPAPASLAAAPSAGGVKFSWKAPSGQIPPSYYKVYRNAMFVGDTASTSFGFTGLAAGSVQSLSVRTMDVAGRLSSPAVVSTTIATGDTQAPTVPTNARASVAGRSVTITWGASVDLPPQGASGLSGYLVHRDYVFIKFVPAGATSFTDAGVAAGTHRYVVRSVDKNNLQSAKTAPINVSVR